MRFENVAIWKRSRDLAIGVYKETAQLRDFGFRDQITRSCLSISSNIAEGLERNSDKDKRYFLSVAKGSLAEFKSQADISKEIGYIEAATVRDWLQESEQIAAMLSSFIKKLQSE